jgi:hypothetical protein
MTDKFVTRKKNLIVHNFFIQSLQEAKVQREAVHFFNKEADEVYIPDWIIEQNGHKYIIEYFGLYGSDLYPGYTDKTKRKIAFYPSIAEYQFIAIYPEDFKEEGFERLARILQEAKIQVVNNY